MKVKVKIQFLVRCEMSPQEINAYMKGHEKCFSKILDIISIHVHDVSYEMIKDLEEYSKSMEYQACAMLDGQINKLEVFNA